MFDDIADDRFRLVNHGAQLLILEVATIADLDPVGTDIRGWAYEPIVAQKTSVDDVASAGANHKLIDNTIADGGAAEAFAIAADRVRRDEEPARVRKHFLSTAPFVRGQHVMPLVLYD